jgi:hypothetical protein
MSPAAHDEETTNPGVMSKQRECCCPIPVEIGQGSPPSGQRIDHACLYQVLTNCNFSWPATFGQFVRGYIHGPVSVDDGIHSAENCVRYRWPATTSYRYSEVMMGHIGQPEGSRGWVQTPEDTSLGRGNESRGSSVGR